MFVCGNMLVVSPLVFFIDQFPFTVATPSPRSSDGFAIVSLKHINQARINTFQSLWRKIVTHTYPRNPHIPSP